MTDTNDTKRPAKTLTLKKTEMSTVKQSFSHGRTKAVVVEKKRATGAPPGAAKPAEPAKAPKKRRDAPAATSATPARPAAPRPGVVLRQLTEEEKIARTRALAGARVEEVEARRRAEEEARRRAEEGALLAKEREAALRRKAEEDARKAAEETARKHAEEELARRDKKTEAPGTTPAALAADAPRVRRVNAEEE